MPSILIIRLGAMGDVIHALPAAATLKQNFPDRKTIWLLSPRWMPLLEGNPFIDELIPFDRTGWHSWRKLRGIRPDLAVDFQGLVQSALAGRMARPGEFYGFASSVAREPLASIFYTHRISVTGPHRVQRNLQLVAAAGATKQTQQAWIPQGSPEGELPTAPFVLTSPFAGWGGKQWPLAHYERLGQFLSNEGVELVVNVRTERANELQRLRYAHIHTSSLSGLIDATRRAVAVMGVDSGPLHLAAALDKPGVALFGPTDPAQTGPSNSRMIVLRAEAAETTYKRGADVHSSMTEISAEQVAGALIRSLAGKAAPVSRQ
ncbi:MAG: glycosyltransferase family 9 protein [Acidobacteriaceae bacterium]|nr:glycosyltransferase family 9 protein [Acidobacteriaceae bacterium]MBV9500026.1 glycosyltransferase family 9 protein [Acidobacteriaceae bacterium]